MLLLSAPALSAPPPWLSSELTVPAAGGGVEQSPALAIDPAAPLHALVAADSGNASPPSAFIGTSADWTTSWSAGGALQYTGSGSTSAGQADVAWGADVGSGLDVYAVDQGSTTGTHTLCSANAGIFFSASDNGGASFDTALPVDVGSSTTELVEPTITTSGFTIYIAYTELKFSGSGCSGRLDSAAILLISSNNAGSSWNQASRVSPLALSGVYRSPALAVLPDGRVLVAFRDDSGTTSRIETEMCVSPAPAVGPACGAGPGLVGPSTVVGDATAPSLVSGLVGAPTPSVAAAGGRVVVAWHAAVDASVRVFAAMSTDNGATFGPPQQIDQAGGGNQIAPELAATGAGRVDAAYLWDAGLGVRATAASANPPLPGATTEAWAQPVVVQDSPAASGAGIPGQTAPLGRRLGVATSAVPASPLPATVVAFTDTTAGQDVHVRGILHGTTAPVIGPQTVTASKNVSTLVTVTGRDEDGDPLTWSVGAQPDNPQSSVSVSDSSRGTFNFRAANQVGVESFDAVATDGVAGHEVHGTITVRIVNDPPEITCSVLNAHQDEAYEIPVASCVKDLNQDPVTVTVDAATGGTIDHTIDGKWLFQPTPHSIATGSFVLHASDGDLTTDGRVIVTVSPPVGKVTLTVTGGPKRREVAAGLAVRLGAQAIDAAGHPATIFWKFGDGSREVQGAAVAHRFRRPGSFKVRVTASNATVTVPVLVRRRAIELVGAPSVAGGVMTVRVLTRAAGALSLRVDSRSQTVAVAAGPKPRTLHMQVTTGPLVRLALHLKPKKKATALLAFSVRRLVLVSPRSAG
ncbi:MAG: hypothetical protein QOK36_2200 [Gaiellales bacterium]|nr:hypothetical protein [Gaiellales bacterium]